MNRKLSKELGYYMPSFFRLHLDTDNSIEDIKDFSDFDFSIFLHEYVHFIQDITTFYGLHNSHVTVEYLRFANNSIVKEIGNDFIVPIQPDQTNKDNLLLNDFLGRLTYGDVFETNIKEIKQTICTLFPIDIPLSEIKAIEVFEVFYSNQDGQEESFSFGAGCIMESMAYLIEKITCKDFAKSMDIPYNIAELLVNKIYPEFGGNLLNIFALCDISLNVSNPAKYFFAILNEWKLKGCIPQNPEILYENYFNSTFTKNGKQINSVKENLKEISNLCISQLQGYFNDPYFDVIKEWINEVFIKAIEYRINNPSFLLLMTKGNIRENKLFIQFFNEIGTPLMTNNKKSFRFYHPLAYKTQISIGYFWAISQIQTLFLGKKKSCELIDLCNQPYSDSVTDNRCINEPWNRSNDSKPCPYGLFWRHWGLSNYKPII